MALYKDKSERSATRLQDLLWRLEEWVCGRLFVDLSRTGSLHLMEPDAWNGLEPRSLCGLHRSKRKDSVSEYGPFFGEGLEMPPADQICKLCMRSFTKRAQEIDAMRAELYPLVVASQKDVVETADIARRWAHAARHIPPTETATTQGERDGR